MLLVHLRCCSRVSITTKGRSPCGKSNKTQPKEIMQTWNKSRASFASSCIWESSVTKQVGAQTIPWQRTTALYCITHGRASSEFSRNHAGEGHGEGNHENSSDLDVFLQQACQLLREDRNTCWNKFSLGPIEVAGRRRYGNANPPGASSFQEFRSETEICNKKSIFSAFSPNNARNEYTCATSEPVRPGAGCGVVWGEGAAHFRALARASAHLPRTSAHFRALPRT